MYDALEGVDALCVFTEWDEFRALDLKKTKKLMKGSLVFDARNLLDQRLVESTGFIYIAVGKRTNGYTEDGISYQQQYYETENSRSLLTVVY